MRAFFRLDFANIACYNNNMSEITAILPQKRDPERCNIYVNGQFYCGMRLDVVMKNRLKCGQDVELSYLDDLQSESEKNTALDKAMTHLSSSMKTEKQISDFLKKKGYVESVIGYVLEKLKEYGFVNDEEYARQYVQSATKNKGRRLIALELQQKGLSKEAAQCAVENMQGEEIAAKKLLEKYMRGKSSDRQTLHKAFRYLISKGFEYDVANNALSSFGEINEDY